MGDEEIGVSGGGWTGVSGGGWTGLSSGGTGESVGLTGVSGKVLCCSVVRAVANLSLKIKSRKA